MRKIVLMIMIPALICGTLFTSCGSTPTTAKSSECNIIFFTDSLNSLTDNWIIAGTNIIGYYLIGTDLSSIVPTIIISENATVYPPSGAKMDFSNDKVVTYTVTAEDGTMKVYKAQAQEEEDCGC